MNADRCTVRCVLYAASLEKASLNETIEEHKQQIVELQRQASDQEKERQAELVKLRLEVRQYYTFIVCHSCSIIF